MKMRGTNRNVIGTNQTALFREPLDTCLRRVAKIDQEDGIAMGAFEFGISAQLLKSRRDKSTYPAVWGHGCLTLPVASRVTTPFIWVKPQLPMLCPFIRVETQFVTSRGPSCAWWEVDDNNKFSTPPLQK